VHASKSGGRDGLVERLATMEAAIVGRLDATNVHLRELLRALHDGRIGSG